MTGGKATWDGMDVQVIPRYVPSEVGEMIVWGVRYRTNGTIMYAETLLRKETSSDAEEKLKSILHCLWCYHYRRLLFAFITIMVLYPSSSVALTTLLSMALLVLQ